MLSRCNEPWQLLQHGTNMLAGPAETPLVDLGIQRGDKILLWSRRHREERTLTGPGPPSLHVWLGTSNIQTFASGPGTARAHRVCRVVGWAGGPTAHTMPKIETQKI